MKSIISALVEAFAYDFALVSNSDKDLPPSVLLNATMESCRGAIPRTGLEFDAVCLTRNDIGESAVVTASLTRSMPLASTRYAELASGSQSIV